MGWERGLIRRCALQPSPLGLARRLTESALLGLGENLA